MGRGVKKRNNDGVLDWQQLFNKNIGKYLQIISIELSKRTHSSFSTNEELLKLIQLDKEALFSERKLKPNKARPRQEIIELRYQIPANWNWFLLSDVAFYQEGPGIRSFQYRDKGIKLLNVENITPNQLRLDLTSRYISQEDFDLKYKHFKLEHGDILFASSGGSWGKACWFEDPGFDVVLNTSTMRIKSFSEKVLLNEYLYLFLKTDFFRNQLEPQLMGMQPNFGSTHFNSVSIPVSPVDQQKRILKFLNDLENESVKVGYEYFDLEVEVAIVNLHKSQLIGSDLAYEFKGQSTYLQLLRQTILQEAVQGKLTKQDPAEEPATELLKRIKAEKEKLIKAGKLKKEKELPPITEDEIPFELPEGWVWCRLGELVTIMDAGWSPACIETPAHLDKWGVLKTTAVQQMEYLEVENKELPSKLTPKEQYEVKSGDILFTRAGPFNRVGVCCLVEDTRSKLMISDKIIRFHLFDKNVSPKFITLCLNTGASKAHIESKKSGMALSQVNISQDNLKLTPIPLPPLAEQQRIVAKVHQLQQQLSQLEAQVQQSRQYAQQLLQSVLKEAFEQKGKVYEVTGEVSLAADK